MDALHLQKMNGMKTFANILIWAFFALMMGFAFFCLACEPDETLNPKVYVTIMGAKTLLGMLALLISFLIAAPLVAPKDKNNDKRDNK